VHSISTHYSHGVTSAVVVVLVCDVFAVCDAGLCDVCDVALVVVEVEFA
jgi:hypothetical protein